MSILITGSDQPLGYAVAQKLKPEHDLHLLTSETDLRDPQIVAPFMEGVAAVLHLANYDSKSPDDENATLDKASRGTYVLLQEAVKAGVCRVIYASRLSLFEDYPEAYVVDETWRPLPKTTAASLAPYLGELVCREFAREGRILAICLRFGDLNAITDGVTTEDAVRAVRQALTMEVAEHDHSWWLFHIASSGRFVSRAAARAPLNFK